MTEAKLYQEHRSQSLLTVMREAVLVVNDKNKITYANPASERLFGISQNQLQGNEISKILSFFDLHGKSLPNSFLETLFKGGAQQSEVKTEIRIKKIKQVVLISSAKLLFADRQKGVLHVFHNITSEAEIQKQKDDFFSIASHELRTPLSIIAGALDNLLHGFGGSTLSDSDTEILRGSLSSTDRLIRLVNDYLNVSRIDQQRLTVSKKEIPVFDLVQKVQKEMAPLFVKNGIVVDIDCPQQDTIVLADDDKLREVLINLLGNSVKFAPNGHIQMTLRSLEGFFEIRIQDNGIGIAPEKQKLLFTRFQQAMDDTLKRQAGGTGLGLYISREFVRLMGGELRLVESIPGKGSIFAFTLPLAVKVA
jgi:PAS domain S-box-containing protein